MRQLRPLTVACVLLVALPGGPALASAQQRIPERPAPLVASQLEIPPSPLRRGPPSRLDAGLRLEETALDSPGGGTRNPVLIPVLGALVGGAGMLGFVLLSCRNTDCIFDPRVPITMGVAAGALVGIVVEVGLQNSERRRATPE